MDLRHVAYFAAAAELGSISRAATKLVVSQPSVTRQIRALERELDVSLLRRSSRGVEATAAGQALLRQYRWIAAEMGRTPEIVRAASTGIELVRVGLAPGIPSEWFLEVVHALRRSHPAVEMDLVDLASSDQEQALRRSTLDLAFMHHAPRDFQSQHLMRQPLGIALHPNRRSKFKSVQRLAELGGAELIAPSTWQTTGQAQQLERTRGAAPEPIRWRFKRFTEHIGLMASSAQADGILLSAASARQFVPSWRWVALESEGQILLHLDTFAVHHKPPMTSVQVIIDTALSVRADAGQLGATP